MRDEQRHPPSEAMPAGLLRLRDLAQRLVATSGQAERNIRIVVTVPTLRLAGVAAVLGALLADYSCHDCEHQQLEPGVRVAGWVSGRFKDASLARLGNDELMFGGITLRGNRETVHRLPEGFPERADTRLPHELRADIAASLGCTPSVAGQRHSARCAHPVVMVGEPGAFRADVTCMAEAETGPSIRGQLESGIGLCGWYRHPVLLMGTVPDAGEVPWAAKLRPRLVVLSGSAGWVGSSRHLWPDVPILVLLSRRSASACETAALISASGWPAAQAVPAALAGVLQPKHHGLEIMSVVEPDTAPPDEDLW